MDKDMWGILSHRDFIYSISVAVPVSVRAPISPHEHCLAVKCFSAAAWNCKGIGCSDSPLPAAAAPAGGGNEGSGIAQQSCELEKGFWKLPTLPSRENKICNRNRAWVEDRG